MSEYIFKLPDLGEGTVESEIGEWNVKVGDVVAEDAIVGTMMTDKAAVELNSPVTGTVKSLAGEPGDMIPVGAALIVFETDASVPVDEQPVDEKPAADPGAVPSAGNGLEVAAPAAPEPVASGAPDVSNGKVVTSPAIRRRAKEAGIDLSQVPGSGAGGRILRKDFDLYLKSARGGKVPTLSLIHISEPTRQESRSRMPSSA